jgi:peptide/nickel transport system substrate-binding protein
MSQRNHASHGRLDRREVVERGVLTGLGATALGSLVAADRASAGALAPAAGRKGNLQTVRMASVDAVRNLDLDGPNPAYFPNNLVWRAVHDTLVYLEIPADLKKAVAQRAKGYPIKPLLAERYEVSNDLKTIRFTLRKGVKSNFGNELSADDVVWTFQRSLANGRVGAFLLTLSKITKPQSLRAANRYTVEAVVDEPTPYFLQLLTLQWLSILDSQEARKHASTSDPWAKEWVGRNIAGFGPYQIVENVPGRPTVLTARKDYWGRKPRMRFVVQQPVTDSSSRLTLLLSGTVDYGEELSPVQLQAVEKNSSTAVDRFTSAVTSYFVFDVTKPPYNDVRIRQGIARAVPYADILKTAYRGQAEQWKTIITPWFFGATDEFWRYDTNPTAARTALAPIAGKEITLSFRSERGADEQVAVLTKAALERVGVPVRLEATLSSVYDQRKLTGGMGFFIASEVPAIVSSLYTLQLFWAKGAFLNMANYTNPEIDSIVKELEPIVARKANTPQEARMLRRAKQILMNDLPFIPFAFPASYAAHRKGFRFDTTPLPGGGLNYRDMYYQA